MPRTLPYALGLAAVIASGIVYGSWTGRWRKSPELEARAAKLRDLPDRVGRWQSTPADLEPDALALAGAEGWWSRRFTDERTGARVQAILLCGRPGPISVHAPQACYAGAGYALEAPPIKYAPPAAPDAAPAEFWTGKFKQPGAGGEELRIFWSWTGDGAWRASDYPRWDFARLPALYKLYVIHETAGPAGRLDDDPAAAFLREALPELTRALSAH